MDRVEFKKLLFKVAFCTMACDGHIDQREIDEMKLMDTSTSFFSGIDLSEELSELVEQFQAKGTTVIEDLFTTLRAHSLTPIQELLVLEVAIRIINSDKKHDDNESRFFHLLRGKLEVHDETISDRFGDLTLLGYAENSQNVARVGSDSEFAKSVILPELAAIKDILLGS